MLSTSIRTTIFSLVAVSSIMISSSVCDAGPIHDAVQGDNLNEVIRLLDSGKDINERVTGDEYCTYTPLHTAVWENKVEIARELLRRGADIKALDQAGRNPVLSAAYNGNPEMIQLLLDNGGKELINNGSIFEGFAVDPETPLGVCMANYKTEAAKILILAGADVNLGDSNGDTPLMSAATGGFVEMVNLLIKHGANVNAETPGYRFTALQAAAGMGHKEIMDTLITHGADQSVRNASTKKTAQEMYEEHLKTEEYLKKTGYKKR